MHLDLKSAVTYGDMFIIHLHLNIENPSDFLCSEYAHGGLPPTVRESYFQRRLRDQTSAWLFVCFPGHVCKSVCLAADLGDLPNDGEQSHLTVKEAHLELPLELPGKCVQVKEAEVATGIASMRQCVESTRCHTHQMWQGSIFA